MSSGMYVTIGVSAAVMVTANALAQSRMTRQKAQEKSQQAREIMARTKAQIEAMEARLAAIHEAASSAATASENAGRGTYAVTQIHNIRLHQEETVSHGVDEDEMASLQITGGEDHKPLAAIDLSRALQQQKPAPEQQRKNTLAVQVAQQLDEEGWEDLASRNKEVHNAYEQFVAHLNAMLDDTQVDDAFFEADIFLRLEAFRRNMASFREQEQKADTLRKEALETAAFWEERGKTTGRAQEAGLQENSVSTETIREFERLQEDYLALCALAGQTPRFISSLEELRGEVFLLQQAQRQKAVDDIVMQNLREVYHELGIEIGEEMDLDGIQGRRMHISGEDDISVFMSADGNGILFETVADVEEGATLSQNQRSRVEEQARSICSLHRKVIEMMKERGITIAVQAEEQPRYETIRKDTRRRAAGTLHAAAGGRKTMADVPD